MLSEGVGCSESAATGGEVTKRKREQPVVRFVDAPAGVIPVHDASTTVMMSSSSPNPLVRARIGHATMADRPSCQGRMGKVGMDASSDDLMVLQRYSRALRLIQSMNSSKIVRARDTGGKANGTAANTHSAAPATWACFYALQPAVFYEKNAQVGTTILVAALLVSVTAPAYLDGALQLGPVPRRLLGAATFSLLAALLVCVTEVMCLGLPYTDMDKLRNWILVGTTLDLVGLVLAYSGVGCLYVALLLYSFKYLPILPLAAALLALFVLVAGLWRTQQSETNKSQERRTEAFLKQFCDEDSGELLPKYQKKVELPPSDLTEQELSDLETVVTKAAGFGRSDWTYFDDLKEADLTLQDMKRLDPTSLRDILREAGITSPGHRLKIAKAIAAYEAPPFKEITKKGAQGSPP